MLAFKRPVSNEIIGQPLAVVEQTSPQLLPPSAEKEKSAHASQNEGETSSSQLKQSRSNSDGASGEESPVNHGSGSTKKT